MDPEIIGRIAERKIQDAIEEGKFDNLPGKGKPLVFDDDPGTPVHLRMSNKVLKNAGVLPDWMQVQKDIIAERQEVATLFARRIKENQKKRIRVESLPESHPDVQAFHTWYAKSRATYLQHLKSVNTSILKFNIIAPPTASAIGYKPYNVENEMALFDAEFLPLSDKAPKDIALEPPVDAHSLKGVARERYNEGAGGGPIRGWIKIARMKSKSEARGSGISEETESEDIGRADVPEEWRKQG